jgi:hypothetical protein
VSTHTGAEKIKRIKMILRIAFAIVALIVGVLLILDSFEDVFGSL